MAEIDYSKHIKRDVATEAREAMAEGDDVAVRGDLAGEMPNEESDTPRESGWVETVKRLFGGDRVLWIIIIALMTISVLVVYSSTAKMAYMPSSGSSTTEFLHSQLGLLAFCVVVL